LAGCCYGAPTESPLGLSFPRHSPAWDKHLAEHRISELAGASLPVHATQLYEAVAAGLICLWTWRRYRRGLAYDGQNFFHFMFLYAAFRFAVEYLRADDRGLWLGGLVSTSQLISLPLLLWAGWVLWRRRPWPALPAKVPAGPGV
jgi:phosphatidylglycerol:prolipoprotein diacylglycerol transferase